VSHAVAGTTLAIHPGALGDVLLAIPALRALRDGGARVTLAAQPRIASLLVALGEADEARDVESLRLDALFAADGRARLPAADRIVCWFGARDPDFGRRLSALAPRVVVASSVSAGPDVWEHLLGTVGESAARARREAARVSDGMIADGRAALRAAGLNGSRLAVVQPGAGGAAKRWPPGAFAQALAPLVARSDIGIVVHEGPADAEPVAQLLPLVPSARVLRLPALPALAGVLAGCAAYLGNDSGISHLGAAVGAPGVVLYSAVNLAWRPWADAARVLSVAIDRTAPDDVREVQRVLASLLE
jgi:heptosyltransferase III